MIYQFTIRERMEEKEESLSPYATKSRYCRGRAKWEEPCPVRTCFQRDRDRIIYSKAFRRLKHKTQVFIAPLSDHYITRLTHTLEVSQIARTIAKALLLNEDLTEAISLGHDLGHTPFGHAGEKILHTLLPNGFAHAKQSLRVVDKLEYSGKGLNLTYEVRDGIAKHSKGKGRILDARKEEMPATLEGQIVRVSDVIAYVNHDIDDALRANVIKREDIPSHLIEMFGKWHANRIDRMVEDVVMSSLEAGLDKIEMSEEITAGVSELRDFLYERVYFNPDARGEFRKPEKILKDLYYYILEHPDDYAKPYPEDDPLEIRVGDVVAGMTDLHALRLYQEIFFPMTWPIL